MQFSNHFSFPFAACVPAIFESMYRGIWKKLEKEGKKEKVLKLLEEHKDANMEKRRKVFKDIHEMFGGHIKTFITGSRI